MLHVVSVGAGRNQLPLIERLQERGYGVVAFDKDSQAPGRTLAQHFAAISTWNAEEALRWLRSLSLEFVGVACLSYAQAVTTQQHLMRALGLPGQTKENVALLHNDKKVLRRLLRESNLSDIEDFTLDVIQKTKPWKASRYIMKPQVGGSSRDVHVVSQTEILKLVDKRMHEFVVQPFLEGQEYRIHAFIQEGELRYIACMKKTNLPTSFLTSQLVRDDTVHDGVQELLAKLAKALELTDVALKIDAIQDAAGNWEIIDLDFVCSGESFETHVGHWMFGYPVLDDYIDLVVGNVVSQRSFSSTPQYRCMNLVYHKENKPIHYATVESALQAELGDFVMRPLKDSGETVGPPTTNMDAIAAVLHNREDLNSIFV